MAQQHLNNYVQLFALKLTPIVTYYKTGESCDRNLTVSIKDSIFPYPISKKKQWSGYARLTLASFDDIFNHCVSVPHLIVINNSSQLLPMHLTKIFCSIYVGLLLMSLVLCLLLSLWRGSLITELYLLCSLLMLTMKLSHQLLIAYR